MTLFARDVHGHHVLCDHLAELDAGVEALLDDVRTGVVDREIEPDVGVTREERREHALGEDGLCDRGYVQAQEPCRPPLQLAQRAHRLSQLRERRAETGAQVLASLGERDAAGRAREELHLEPLLQLLHGLADGRGGDAEDLSGGAKAPLLGHGEEHFEAGDFAAHYLAILISE